MRPSAARVLREGTLAGLLAGLVVVTWFLAVDILAGDPLRTPRRLAAALLDDGAASGVVAAFTVLHFGVFIAIGIAVAGFVALTRVPPGIMLGVVVGLGLLTGVHYGALLATGSSAIAVLPATHVLGANLLAGIALALWLHRSLTREAPLGLAALAEHPFALRGIVTGVVGAGAVAVWFLVLDAVAGRPFFTPAALGAAFFLGTRSPEEVQVGIGIVAAYTVLHGAAFALLGLATVATAEWLERAPSFWLVSALGGFLLVGTFLVAATVFAEWVLGALSPWAVGAGTLIGVGAMAAWVWRTHPMLRRELARVPDDTRV